MYNFAWGSGGGDGVTTEKESFREQVLTTRAGNTYVFRHMS